MTSFEKELETFNINMLENELERNRHKDAIEHTSEGKNSLKI